MRHLKTLRQCELFRISRGSIKLMQRDAYSRRLDANAATDAIRQPMPIVKTNLEEEISKIRLLMITFLLKLLHLGSIIVYHTCTLSVHVIHYRSFFFTARNVLGSLLSATLEKSTSKCRASKEQMDSVLNAFPGSPSLVVTAPYHA